MEGNINRCYLHTGADDRYTSPQDIKSYQKSAEKNDQKIKSKQFELAGRQQDVPPGGKRQLLPSHLDPPMLHGQIVCLATSNDVSIVLMLARSLPMIHR